MIKLKTVALAAISGLMASGACAQAPVAQTESLKVEVTEHQTDVGRENRTSRNG